MPIYLNDETALACIPERQPESHKGDYGKILLLCGSRGYTGAAALAAMGALRSGAGLVYLGVPESIYAIEAMKLTEPVIFPLPDDLGMMSAASIKAIRKLLPNMDAVLFGCGCGLGEGPEQVLRLLLMEAKCPVVLDADGITLVSRHKDILRDRQYPTILTPHEGELARLSPRSGDRVMTAMEFARQLGIILLRKGHRTVITDGKEVYVNQSGNPGMAVGGSGDVLAGIIVSLIGQGVQPLEAAACGAWFHGRAGDLCAQSIGMRGLLPTDMVNMLPRLLK
jgi:NAD(P)H-hydrate epimerase